MGRKKFEDDGRTIADMSNIGSYSGPSMFGRWDQLKGKSDDQPPAGIKPDSDFTSKEKFWVVMGALKASLLIGLAFIVGLGLVVVLLMLLWSIL